jgi:hypothetical protein
MELGKVLVPADESAGGEPARNGASPEERLQGVAERGDELRGSLHVVISEGVRLSKRWPVLADLERAPPVVSSSAQRELNEYYDSF